MSFRRNSYTAEFKLRAIDLAAEINLESGRPNGNNYAAKFFNIDERLLRRWRSEEAILRSSERNRRSFRYRKPLWPEIDEELKAWVLEQRAKNRQVSMVAIQCEAKRIATSLNLESFNASTNWCYNFMRRSKLSVPVTTSTSQQLSADYYLNFCQFMNDETRDTENLNDVPVSFDSPSSNTIDQRELHNIPIPKIDSETSTEKALQATKAKKEKRKEQRAQLLTRLKVMRRLRKINEMKETKQTLMECEMKKENDQDSSIPRPIMRTSSRLSAKRMSEANSRRDFSSNPPTLFKETKVGNANVNMRGKYKATEVKLELEEPDDDGPDRLELQTNGSRAAKYNAASNDESDAAEDADAGEDAPPSLMPVVPIPMLGRAASASAFEKKVATAMLRRSARPSILAKAKNGASIANVNAKEANETTVDANNEKADAYDAIVERVASGVAEKDELKTLREMLTVIAENQMVILNHIGARNKSLVVAQQKTRRLLNRLPKSHVFDTARDETNGLPKMTVLKRKIETPRYELSSRAKQTNNRHREPSPTLHNHPPTSLGEALGIRLSARRFQLMSSSVAHSSTAMGSSGGVVGLCRPTHCRSTSPLTSLGLRALVNEAASSHAAALTNAVAVVDDDDDDVDDQVDDDSMLPATSSTLPATARTTTTTTTKRNKSTRADARPEPVDRRPHLSVTASIGTTTPICLQHFQNGMPLLMDSTSSDLNDDKDEDDAPCLLQYDEDGETRAPAAKRACVDSPNIFSDLPPLKREEE